MSDTIHDTNTEQISAETMNVSTETTTTTETVVNTEETKKDVTENLSDLPLDVLLKVPTVKSLLESARTQEKDKVYKSLEAKDNKIKTLEAEIMEIRGQIKEKENNNLSEQEILMREIKDMTSQIENLKASIEQERKKAEEEKRLARFEAYKERKLRELQEAGTEYLPDLLSGSTEEEFNESIDKAVSRYAEIRAQLESKIAATKEPKAKPSSPSVTNPSGNQTQVLSAEDIRKMSPAEYAKVREKVLQQTQKGL